MVTRQLSSLQHPLVKKMVKLRDNKRFRQTEKTALVTGEKVIREVSQSCKIKTLITTAPLALPADESYVATPEILHKIMGYPAEDLAAAEVYLPSYPDLATAKKIAVLDQVCDPGNVGTIFRSALALGWDGIFILEGGVDPYNDKAVRASQGAVLKLPWHEVSWNDLLLFLQRSPRQTVIADLRGTPLPDMQFSLPLLLVLGHETQGPSLSARALGKAVTIPMARGVESLNVAMAAAILFYHIRT